MSSTNGLLERTPSGQHTGELLGAESRTGQVEHVPGEDPGVNPGGHGAQLPAPAADAVPRAHGLHAVAPARDDVPAEH